MRQRPGKPLFFGIKKETYLFALPGNPASTLSCFYVYVVPLIKKLQGADGKGLSRFQLPITHRFSTKEPRALFLKAYVEKQRVTIWITKTLLCLLVLQNQMPWFTFLKLKKNI